MICTAIFIIIRTEVVFLALYEFNVSTVLFRSLYWGFQNMGDLPVVGWNAGDSKKNMFSVPR